MTASTATADTPLRQASMRLGGMLADRLVARGLNVLFQVRLGRERLRVGVPIALLSMQWVQRVASSGTRCNFMQRVVMQRVERHKPS